MKQHLLIFFMVWVCCVSMMAQHISCNDTQSAFNDTIDRDADDFVEAYLMIADPANVLYSSFGHAFLRMKCPTFSMDYCFSYEGEDQERQVLSFLAGRLKMGMFIIPTSDFLLDYADNHRGVRQYKLHIPIEARRELWRVLDEKVEEGMNLPYDYVKRSCAATAAQFIFSVIDQSKISNLDWGEYENLTIRDLAYRNLRTRQWSNWIVLSITGTTADQQVHPLSKMIIPADLVNFLSRTELENHPIIAEYEQLIPSGEDHQEPLLTPVKCAVALLLLALLACFISNHAIDYFLLSLQTLLGLIIVYLVLFSSLPNTDWNWLIIPFNPLPFICWKWRKYTNLCFAGIDIVWMCTMLLYPHILVHPANIILTAAFAIILLKNSFLHKYSKKLI